MNYNHNPFIAALARDIVDTTHFIGREYDLQRIENKVILPELQRANVAIIGLPDIGKYSLIYKVLLARKAELQQRRLFPIEIDLTTYTESGRHDRFFHDLIYLLKSELED